LRSSSTLLNQAAAVLNYAGRLFLRSFLGQRAGRQGEKNTDRARIVYVRNCQQFLFYPYCDKIDTAQIS
jgi:hypothetical protein